MGGRSWWAEQKIFWTSLWRLATGPGIGRADRDYFGLVVFTQDDTDFLGVSYTTNRGTVHISVLEDETDEALRARAEVAHSIAALGDELHERWERWRGEEAARRPTQRNEILGLTISKITLHDYDDPTAGELYFDGDWPNSAWHCGYDHAQARFYNLAREE